LCRTAVAFPSPPGPSRRTMWRGFADPHSMRAAGPTPRARQRRPQVLCGPLHRVKSDPPTPRPARLTRRHAAAPPRQGEPPNEQAEVDYCRRAQPRSVGHHSPGLAGPAGPPASARVPPADGRDLEGHVSPALRARRWPRYRNNRTPRVRPGAGSGELAGWFASWPGGCGVIPALTDAVIVTKLGRDHATTAELNNDGGPSDGARPWNPEPQRAATLAALT